jgi:hypothetical protein
MDNRKIEIESTGNEDFRLAFILACSKWGDRSKFKIKGFKVVDDTLWLYEYEDKEMTAFPFDLDIGDATNFAWGYIEKTPCKLKQPDHDGDNEKGFSLIANEWNQNKHFVEIKPIWAMYGK